MSKKYNFDIEELRQREYPHMNNGVYLDHSGTTIYAKSVMDGFYQKMVANLYGNPHSENSPAKLSGDVVDAVRLKTLTFLGADPNEFDLVFVANATAAVKLVAESFRDLAEKTRERRFWYGYHKDAHTSLVGVRELTRGNARCFESDDEVEAWLRYPDHPYHDEYYHNDNNHHYSHQKQGYHGATAATQRQQHGHGHGLGLFAYPGQSNMTGRRLPLSWAGRARRSRHLQNTYTLLDAAALAMTSPMGQSVFRDADSAPDFTCLSLYKIFGFPDLGALVVRKQSGHVLALRRYFGGGTVTMVATLGDEVWHRSKALQQGQGQGQQQKEEAAAAVAAAAVGGAGVGVGGAGGGGYQLHEGLEDGTLPFHSILALGEAIDVHARLYGSMAAVSAHTSRLTARMYRALSSLRHANGMPLVRVYHDDLDRLGVGVGEEVFGDPARQGSAVAFNVLRADGQYVAYADVERRANAAGIYVRSGGVCNPGGIFTLLGYEPWMTERALSAGHHCGSQGIGIIHRMPTGIVRASVGAMSTKRDVDALIEFLGATYLQGYGKKAQAQVQAQAQPRAQVHQARQVPVSSSPKPLLSTMTSTSTLYSASPPPTAIHTGDPYQDDDDSNDDHPLVDYHHHHNHHHYHNNNKLRHNNFKTAGLNNNASNTNLRAAAASFTEVRELPRPLRTTLPYHQRYAATPPPPSMPMAMSMAPMAAVSSDDDEDAVVPRQFPMPLTEVVCGAAR